MSAEYTDKVDSAAIAALSPVEAGDDESRTDSIRSIAFVRL